MRTAYPAVLRFAKTTVYRLPFYNSSRSRSTDYQYSTYQNHYAHSRVTDVRFTRFRSGVSCIARDRHRDRVVTHSPQHSTRDTLTHASTPPHLLSSIKNGCYDKAVSIRKDSDGGSARNLSRAFARFGPIWERGGWGRSTRNSVKTEATSKGAGKMHRGSPVIPTKSDRVHTLLSHTQNEVLFTLHSFTLKRGNTWYLCTCSLQRTRSSRG